MLVVPACDRAQFAAAVGPHHSPRVRSTGLFATLGPAPVPRDLPAVLVYSSVHWTRDNAAFTPVQLYLGRNTTRRNATDAPAFKTTDYSWLPPGLDATIA